MMRFDHEVLIGLPREAVWREFDDPDNLPRWQPTLQSFETIDGEPGRPGARSRLIYRENGRTVELIETITERREPELFSGTYVSSMAKNTLVNRFEIAGPDTTRWIMQARFRFFSLPMRLFSFAIRPAIRRRLREDMERFRALAESRGAPG